MGRLRCFRVILSALHPQIQPAHCWGLQLDGALSAVVSYCSPPSCGDAPPPAANLVWCLVFMLHCRLNYINDFDPVSHQFKQPIYAIGAGVTKTGSLDCYKPKGAWDNPTKRNWLKYEVRES